MLPIKQLSPRTINLSVSSALYHSEVPLQISILCFPVAAPIFPCWVFPWGKFSPFFGGVGMHLGC